MVVGMATSDGDLLSWTDLGPLWITNRSYTYDSIIESPHLFQHDGLWYLFYTTNAGQPLTFSTGADPTGPPGSWTYRGRLSSVLGQNTLAWYASEGLSDGLVDYFAFVLGDRIDVRRIVWGADWRFSLTQPDFTHVVRMTWDSTRVAQDSTVTLALIVANPSGTVQLEGLRVRGDGSQVPVPLDSIGLPTVVPLTGDTTRVSWPARFLADPGDTSRTLRLLVRLPDRTAAAPELDVVPPPVEIHGMSWDRSVVEPYEPTTLSIAAVHWEGASVRLGAQRLRSDSTRVAVPLDSLGLPATVGLTADTTRVPWVARFLADSTDTARVLRLEVALADSSATAPLLEVLAPVPLEVLGMAWDRPLVTRDSTATLSVSAAHWRARSVNLAAWRVQSDSTRVAVPLDSLRLPAQLPLTGDTTRLAWVARRPASLADSGRTMRIVVGLEDSMAVAGPLDVYVPLALVAAPGAPGGGDLEPKRNMIRLRPSGLFWAVEIQLAQPSAARLDLFDAQGRRVHSLLNQALPAGSTVVRWDGRDAGGARVVPGIYFARFTTPRSTSVLRLVQLH
jgi:hypothetical protein